MWELAWRLFPLMSSFDMYTRTDGLVVQYPRAVDTHVAAALREYS